MPKHLRMLLQAKAEECLVSTILQDKEQIVQGHPVLEKSLRAIEQLEMNPDNLLSLEYLRPEKNSSGSQYDEEGRCFFWDNSKAIVVFSNHWLRKADILPRDVVKVLISLGHERRYCYEKKTYLRFRAIDSSLRWDPFMQVKGNDFAWVATRLMDHLWVPAEICHCCGRGKDEKDWVECSTILLGAVWGTGPYCLGSGYFVLEVTRGDNRELCEVIWV